jgi:hypothetical protein
MGDAGNAEMYSAGIAHFDRALAVAASEDRSKRLKPSDEASVRYSLGYAQVSSYEREAGSDPNLLRDAKKNFDRCLQIDRNYGKADRAKKKLEQWLQRSISQKTEKYGPVVIGGLSLTVCGLAQWKFFLTSPPLSFESYAVITFASLFFMIAGLYLPQIIKLRFGGIELEKSSIDQATAVRSFGISRNLEEGRSASGPPLEAHSQ